MVGGYEYMTNANQNRINPLGLARGHNPLLFSANQCPKFSIAVFVNIQLGLFFYNDERWWKEPFTHDSSNVVYFGEKYQAKYETEENFRNDCSGRNKSKLW